MIIGLSYRARVGKDTTADYLVKKYGFTKLAFADSLKKACEEIFNLSQAQLYGDLKEIIDPYWKLTPRYILQKVGTECMRKNFDSDIWVKSLKAKISSNGRYVITDVRFLNEIEAIKSWSGICVKVNRNLSGASGGISNHESEISLDNYDKWDYILDNNGTIDDLYSNIETMLGYINTK